MKTLFKLYEIPKGSIIRGLTVDGKEEDIIFDHIDGMYSYCVTAKTKSVVHLKAYMSLRKKHGFYEVAE